MFGSSVEMDSFEYVAPHANFLYKTIFGNMWLFKGILSSILSGDPATDAIQSTTTVGTTFVLFIFDDVNSGKHAVVNGFLKF